MVKEGLEIFLVRVERRATLVLLVFSAYILSASSRNLVPSFGGLVSDEADIYATRSGIKRGGDECCRPRQVRARAGGGGGLGKAHSLRAWNGRPSSV